MINHAVLIHLTLLTQAHLPSCALFGLNNSSQGKSVEAGTLKLLSMGQGQEAPAAAALQAAAQSGGWVVLDNVHLMQVGLRTRPRVHHEHYLFFLTFFLLGPSPFSHIVPTIQQRVLVPYQNNSLLKIPFAQGWLPTLERLLESCAANAHPEFRCFFSAEPIAGAPLAAVLPEGLVQSVLTVANEPPSGLRSNMRRALACFSQVGFMGLESADRCFAGQLHSLMLAQHTQEKHTHVITFGHKRII